MKVFFTASREGYPQLQEQYQKIVKICKELGHSIYEDVIENSQKNINFADFENRYKKITNWIKASEVVIAEISTSSTGVGHEIYQAIAEKKQVIVLFNGKMTKDQAATLRGNPSKHVQILEYSLDDIAEKLKEALNIAKQKLDTKFILIISPEIDRYLEWCGDNRRMHKAQVVRTAVEDMMSKDKEYKESLKSAGV